MVGGLYQNEQISIFPATHRQLGHPITATVADLGLYTGVALSSLDDLAMECSRDLAGGTSLSLSLSLPTCSD